MEKQKKEKMDQGEEQTEIKTNSDPSKGCQIYHATYKYVVSAGWQLTVYALSPEQILVIAKRKQWVWFLG